jgi:hypothetical protein
MRKRFILGAVGALSFAAASQAGEPAGVLSDDPADRAASWAMEEDDTDVDVDTDTDDDDDVDVDVDDGDMD